MLIGWLHGSKQKTVSTPPKFGNSSARPFAGITPELIRACYGDRKQAERLTEYMQEKVPGISRAEAVSRALERLMEDRVR